MESLAHFLTPEAACGYLPQQQWLMEYEVVGALSAQEYAQRLLEGWRRFGHALFRPRCRACRACRSLRVGVANFRPNRSQRRNLRENDGALRLVVGTPALSRGRLDLYDRFHAFQSQHKGWREHGPKDVGSYAESFVQNPFPTEEWRYYLGNRLVGVGYVDVLPVGLSAIYFFHDPEERQRGLGTWNVLSIIRSAAARGLPHVYLGYYVAGCPSLEYKANFQPNEALDPDGRWVTFRP
jgi:arginine-tRNA-protein transferase